MLIQWFITQQTDTLCMAMNKVIATSTYCQYCSQNIPNWSYTDAIVVSVVTTSILIFAFSSAVSPEKRTPVKYSAFQEKPFLGILSWQPADQSKLISALISDLKPEQVRSHSTIPCLPAHMLFMCLRYPDHCANEEQALEFMESVVKAIQQLTQV